MNKATIKSRGFTIVELLIVIVVIGILAAITIVSYNGITQRAKSIALQSDLDNAKTTLQLYQIEYGSYPTSLDGSNCPKDAYDVVDTKYCLKSSSGTSFSYIPGGSQQFSLIATGDASMSIGWSVTESTLLVAIDLVKFTANGTGRNGIIQTWIVPATGTYIIAAWGAQGGGSGGGGLGAYIKGDIDLTVGSVLKILVGQTPVLENGYSYYGHNYSGGGGGGTFITTDSNQPLIIAGGGGGYLKGTPSSNPNINGQSVEAGANSLDSTGIGGSGGGGGTGSNNGWGGGGGGLSSDGTNGSQCSNTGGKSFVNVNGGVGGGTCSFASGGFGGGGGTHGNTGGGGGGGGYSGGGGSGQNTNPNFGGGGGSYNFGTNKANSAGINTGDGKVLIIPV